MLDFTESFCLLSWRYNIVNCQGEKKAAAQADKVSGGMNIFWLPHQGFLSHVKSRWKRDTVYFLIIKWYMDTPRTCGNDHLSQGHLREVHQSRGLLATYSARLPHLTRQVNEQAREWMSLDIHKKSYFPRGSGYQNFHLKLLKRKVKFQGKSNKFSYVFLQKWNR